MKLEGIHHVTAITGDAPGNVDFYADKLGLRLVKKTVNQDDPTVYHLFYADEKGGAGSDITFFEYPGAAQGRAGAGMVHRVALARRLGGVARLLGGAARCRARPDDDRCASPIPKGSSTSSSSIETGEEPLTARAPGDPGRARAPRLRRRARVHAAIPERSDEFLERARVRAGLGRARRATAAAPTSTTRRRRAPASRAPAPCTTSRGPRTPEEHEAWRERVAGRQARAPTPVIDRFYFKSIYFREPSGVLFEIATIGPGFTADEPLESLGERLSLPPDFEAPPRAGRADADADHEPARERGRRLSLVARGREGEPEGALVLFHGRGADEHDLVPLLDVLDPERRFVGDHAARAALAAARRRALVRGARDRLPGPRDVPRRRTRLRRPSGSTGSGFPTGAHGARRLLAGRGDELRAVARRGPSAPGVGARAQRLRPDGRGLRARPRARRCRRSRSATARYDPVIGVEWGRRARALLEEAGAEVLYREYPLPHSIDPRLPAPGARLRHGSDSSSEYMTWSRGTPSCSIHARSTPSRRKPAFSATRCDARFSTSAWSCNRR